MGEMADELIERMIFGDDPFGISYEKQKPKTLQDFANDKVKAAENDKKTKNLNKGVIEW